MKLFGLEIKKTVPVEKALSPVPRRGFWQTIWEPFAGAWQRNIEEKQCDVVCYPTVYACMARISQDVGKMPFQLMQENSEGIFQVVSNPAYSPVLNKPNHYQTAQQFREAWILSKLSQGNTYVLKRRDNRGVVNALYVLDPESVMPMVSDSGDVFYQIMSGSLNLAPLPTDYPTTNLVIPASEIIHDRCMPVHHQLIGVPPLCAAYWPAVKNLKILKNSANFFANGARPGGILIAPAGISDEDAAAISQHWQSSYGGENAGKVAVIGADLKYQALTDNASSSQLVEQMRYSDAQICQAFGVPAYIIMSDQAPAGQKADDLFNIYYSLTLQTYVEAMEYLLDEGLGITKPLSVELDIETLIRMDAQKRAEVEGTLVDRGISTINEARKPFNRRALEGGDTVYMQQQDFPLDQVRNNKIVQATETPAQEEPEMTDEEMDQAMDDAA